MPTKKPAHEQNYTAEERIIAEHIIGLEKSALDKWLNGDNSGYKKLWSKRSFTYFDAVVTQRIDDHATIARFLKTIEGKLFAGTYDFVSPRVQIGQDMAVLTFQVFAKTTLIDLEYNCVEVYQKRQMYSGGLSTPHGRLSAPWIRNSATRKV